MACNFSGRWNLYDNEVLVDTNTCMSCLSNTAITHKYLKVCLNSIHTFRIEFIFDDPNNIILPYSFVSPYYDDPYWSIDGNNNLELDHLSETLSFTHEYKLEEFYPDTQQLLIEFTAQVGKVGNVEFTPRCFFEIFIPINYKICIPCPVKCFSQFANIPSSRVLSLLDTQGIIHQLPNYNYVGCASIDRQVNEATAQAIKDMISMDAGCSPELLSVTIDRRFNNPLCLKLTILNSPIEFKGIFMGVGELYLFDRTHCKG